MLAYDICGQRKRDKQGNQPGPDLYLGHTEMSGQRSGPEDHKRHHGHATSHRVTTAQECEQMEQRAAPVEHEDHQTDPYRLADHRERQDQHGGPHGEQPYSAADDCGLRSVVGGNYARRFECHTVWP